MKSAPLLILFALGAMVFPSLAATKTVYVDKNYGSGGTGTKAAPYETINKALTDFNADTIVVMPGVYQEQLLIKKNIRILGYDGPHTTILDGSVLPPDAVIVWPDAGLDVALEGIKITGGSWGVSQRSKGKMLLRNVVVSDARKAGVQVYRDGVTANLDAPRLTLLNCVLFGNEGHGLQIYVDDYRGLPWVTVYNCAFVANGGHGVGFYAVNYNPSISSGYYFMDYNVAIGNAEGNYSIDFAPGKAFSPGVNSFEADPSFVGGDSQLSSKDFRLTPTSPLRDAGKPDLGFLDPDGTRNDIGAYGGPGARTFYTNPNDGPIVREVTVDKGVVPKGETFTIRAKAAVR